MQGGKGGKAADTLRLVPDLVRRFINDAHGDLASDRAMLDDQPALINAAWDWGGGDWETGLGAAAHLGRRDIALHLIAHGARMDIFAAAMPGHLDIVRATLDAYADARTWRGTHGIPLLKHAEAGGAPASRVLEYLQGHERK